MGELLGCMIATINRPTLPAAINSALSQFDEVIVIADDTNLDIAALPEGPVYIKTGRRFDRYGSACWNLGAYVTRCDYITQLGDDDEWTPDAVDIIRRRMHDEPDVDVWIPGLRYNDGHDVCMTAGLGPGNVAAPITTPRAYFTTPFTAAHAEHAGLTDYAHIASLTDHDHTLGWIGAPIYLVRPHALGRHGDGR